MCPIFAEGLMLQEPLYQNSFWFWEVGVDLEFLSETCQKHSVGFQGEFLSSCPFCFLTQEGARTYGSTFEKTTTKQMLRVPFAAWMDVKFEGKPKEWDFSWQEHEDPLLALLSEVHLRTFGCLPYKSVDSRFCFSC